MMLPLLGTFVEPCVMEQLSVLLPFFFFFFDVFSILKSCPFKADFIFGNSQKYYRAKSGEQDRYSISAINFWASNCLTESGL
jgi:hypothetical protein